MHPRCATTSENAFVESPPMARGPTWSRPGTSLTGTDPVDAARPSSPEALWPKARTLPPAIDTRVAPGPAATTRAPSLPAARPGGLGEVVDAGPPSWPPPLAPHAHRCPAPSTPTLWSALVATVATPASGVPGPEQ